MTDTMPPTRTLPKAAQAAGILCVVFGMTGMLGSLYFAQAMADPIREMIADPALRSDGYTHAIQLGAGGLSRLLMIIGGAGLLLGRPWGRWTALGYGAFTVGLVLTSLFLHPAAPDMPEALERGIALPTAAPSEGVVDPVSVEAAEAVEPGLVQQAVLMVSNLFLPVLTVGLMLRQDVRDAYGRRRS